MPDRPPEGAGSLFGPLAQREQFGKKMGHEGPTGLPRTRELVAGIEGGGPRQPRPEAGRTVSLGDSVDVARTDQPTRREGVPPPVGCAVTKRCERQPPSSG